MTKTDLLIASAARLYSIGVDLEALRSRGNRLLESKGPGDPEVIEAARDFGELCSLWSSLEREHVLLLNDMIS